MDHLKTTIDSIRNLKWEYFNEKFLPDVFEHKRRNDSQFSNLLQQLWGTERVLCHLSSSNSEAHWLLLQELDCVVGRAITLVKEVCFKSKDSTSSLEHDTGEHYLEVFLDLRWWTWVLICNAPFRTPCLRKSFFVTPKGVLDLSSSRLPSFLQKLYLWWSSSDGYARRLPSYGIEVFVQKTQGLSSLVEWLKPEGGNPLDKFVLQSAEIFIIEGKVLEPVLYAQKPSWVGDELKVDLTQVVLGMSNSGVVIKCKDSGTEYALKRLQNLDQRQPVIARLCHPHIVQLMSYWRENGFLFLMMELMEGDFKDLIRRRLRVKKSPFIMNVVLDILLQIAKAMLYIHDMGLTHPHLKSSDVLFKEAADRSKLDKNDTKYLVKLGDFQFYSHNDFESMVQQNVYQFGLICLEVLSTEPLHWELEERVRGVCKEPGRQFDEIQKSHGDAIPGSLTQCITRCLGGSIKFSEVVVRLLLAQLQVLIRATKETSPRSIDSEHQGILSSPGSSSRFTMITEEVDEKVAEVGKGTSVQDEIEQQRDPFHSILNVGIDEFINASPKAETLFLVPALADLEYLPTPRARQAPLVSHAAPPQASMSQASVSQASVSQASEPTLDEVLDEVYADYFRPLERGLEARMALRGLKFSRANSVGKIIGPWEGSNSDPTALEAFPMGGLEIQNLEVQAVPIGLGGKLDLPVWTSRPRELENQSWMSWTPDLGLHEKWPLFAPDLMPDFSIPEKKKDR